MSKRTNTAVWSETQKRWKLGVQKDGVRKWFYSSTPGRTGQREANKKADLWLDENINSGVKKIGLFWEDFLEEKRITTSYANYVRLKSIGNAHMLPALKHIKITSLTEQHLQNIINKAYKKNLSRKTLLEIRGTIMDFLKFCRKNKATTLYPESLYIPHAAKYKTKHILQPSALKILFESDKTSYYCKTITDKHIHAYRFQVLTGLRPGELLALKEENIDGYNVTIKHSRNCFNEITDGKTKNANRTFYMSELAKSELNAQLQNKDSEYIFGDMTLYEYRGWWQRYCKYNNIEYVTLYELRHTFISIAKNLPNGDLKTLVGHSPSMDTLGVYGHEVDGELKQIAKKLDKIYDDLLT